MTFKFELSVHADDVLLGRPAGFPFTLLPFCLVLFLNSRHSWLTTNIFCQTPSWTTTLKELYKPFICFHWQLSCWGCFYQSARCSSSLSSTSTSFDLFIFLKCRPICIFRLVQVWKGDFLFLSLLLLKFKLNTLNFFMKLSWGLIYKKTKPKTHNWARILKKKKQMSQFQSLCHRVEGLSCLLLWYLSYLVKSTESRFRSPFE